MKKIIIFLLLFFILANAKNAFATSDILLNEIVVDQSPQSVELLNTSSAPVDLSSWYIDDNGGTSFYSIPSNTIIYPHSCLVFSSEFNLNKSSADSARLFDATAVPTSPSAHLVDSYTYTAGPGGLLSFARIPDGQNWATASASIGKFNSTGQSCIVLPTATPTPTPTPTVVATSTPTPTTPAIDQTISPTPSQEAVANIHISEAMVNPETGENEWVELYNDNEFVVNLSNWYIDDVESAGSAPKQFSISIPAKGYAVYTLSSGMFNNDSDSVRLLDASKTEVDSFEYSVSEKGKSIGRIDFISDTFCDQEPSKNTLNSSCLLMETPEPTSMETASSLTNVSTPTATPSDLTTPLDTQLQSSFSVPYEHINYASLFKPVQPLSTPKSSFKKPEEISGGLDTNSSPSLTALIKSFSILSGAFPLLSISSLLLKRTILK